MNRSMLTLGVSMTTFALLAAAEERSAKACGGCFHPPTQTQSDITDERMLLSVSPTRTTLYDQLRYTGNPKSFAWVLPIHGTVDVGLSADLLFGSIDQLTTTQIISPPVSCPGPPAECQTPPVPGAAGATAADGGAGGGVTVTKQENVGPYATVQLHATDPTALNQWLAQNGYNVPADVQPVVDQYVTEGFDFLAMKLLPNQGVQAMRPVRVTMPGASLSLPLRMAAVGTGASVGITIWVVSDGRYEPQNFPFYHIEDKDLVWDFSTELSNYTTLRQQNEAALGGRGWEIESSLDLNEQLITNVIRSGGRYYGGGGVSGGPSAPAEDDYLAIGDPDAGASDGGTTETAEEVRNADLSALFAGMTGPNVRVTRMRSDISHAAMTTDFLLRASPDQTELSNIRQVTNSVNLTCPIYSNCKVVSYAPPAEAAAANAANGGSAGAGGCVTSPGTKNDNVARFGVLAGMIGLVVARAVRNRRRAARKG